MKVSRRVVLKGLGGVTLTLPFLEGLTGRKAEAADEGEPFAIFFRQANGVSAEQRYTLGETQYTEPERFWPHEFGPLTPENLAGRVLEELVDYADKLLVVKNINMENFPYDDGHARGALQCLTAQGPVEPNLGGDSEADGESLDHRVGRELNPDGRDSLFLYAGPKERGWLGGACVSYRGPAERRSALDPRLAYETMVGQTGGLSLEAIEQLVHRNRSVNDLVRDQLQQLLSNPRLSSNDRQRLDLHLSSIRDLETALSCRMSQSQEMELDGVGNSYQSTNGDELLAAVRVHMDIAVLAIACGYTRSVAIQVGSGNDGETRYRDTETGQLMENFHYVSHRLLSHNATGEVYADAARLHEVVDRHFARTFKYLLDKLSEYQIGSGTLLDQGVAVWLNDLGNGPNHSPRNCPYIIAGSAGGFLKQGQYINLDNGQNVVNIARVLNTLGSAAGLRKINGDLIDDFGDPSLDRRPHPDLMA